MWYFLLLSQAILWIAFHGYTSGWCISFIIVLFLTSPFLELENDNYITFPLCDR